MTTKPATGIYKQMQKFADLTRMMIARNDMPRVKKCLDFAENLLINGNKQTKNAVAMVYVYAVSGTLELNHCNIGALFPKTLKAEYIKQINAF